MTEVRFVKLNKKEETKARFREQDAIVGQIIGTYGTITEGTGPGLDRN